MRILQHNNTNIQNKINKNINDNIYIYIYIYIYKTNKS